MEVHFILLLLISARGAVCFMCVWWKKQNDAKRKTLLCSLIQGWWLDFSVLVDVIVVEVQRLFLRAEL